LKQLKKLNLSYNELYSIPNEIGNLDNLIELELHFNQLTVIPNDIGNLNNLKKLKLNNNQITSIPDTIGKLYNLIELDLHNNQLNSIPYSVTQLIKLQKIWIQNNLFTLDIKNEDEDHPTDKKLIFDFIFKANNIVLQPKKPRKIYFSYGWKDSKSADTKSIGKIDPRYIANAIEQNVNEKCWIDDFKPGDDNLLVMEENINKATVFIACISKQYAESNNCWIELNSAINFNKQIILAIVGYGMTLEYLNLPKEIKGIYPIDFTDPAFFNNNLNKLYDLLKECLL